MIDPSDVLLNTTDKGALPDSTSTENEAGIGNGVGVGLGIVVGVAIGVGVLVGFGVCVGEGVLEGVAMGIEVNVIVASIATVDSGAGAAADVGSESPQAAIISAPVAKMKVRINGDLRMVVIMT